MTHLWLRAEPRAYERRVGLMPEGVAALIAEGFRVSVEESAARIVPTEAYRAAGAGIVDEGSWPDAPGEAIIYGLKELPEGDDPLRHTHVMFGHAFKGQPGADRFLARFRAGGGALLDLEYLTDATGRRVAAFGVWAGYVGAAVSLLAWAARAEGRDAPGVSPWENREALATAVRDALEGRRPRVLVIGALGRTGRGAVELCREAGLEPTQWDMAETAGGGPYPAIFEHDVMLNCILAGPDTPVFVPKERAGDPGRLRVIGDVSCDPGNPISPVPLYDAATTWAAPVVRAGGIDVMAIDNLPSLLPLEASEDFAAQMLPHLSTLPGGDVWKRARAVFERHASGAGGT